MSSRAFVLRAAPAAWLLVLCAAAGFGCSAAGEGDSGKAKAALVSEAGADWQLPIDVGGEVSSAGVATDAAGNALVTGYRMTGVPPSRRSSSDAFLAQYSAEGELLWSRLLGTADSDAAAGVSTDPDGNVFIAGDTSGSLAAEAGGWGDGFVAKYSPEGELAWVQQLGTPEPDAALAVSADAQGDVFVAGFTRGTLEGSREGNDTDAWVAKYSAAGERLWTRQLGSSRGYDERASGVSADASGSVFIAGHTFGALDGENQGSADGFVAKLSGQGDLLWIRQRGSAGYDAVAAVSADASGEVVVAGQMGGVIAGGPSVVLPGWPVVARYSALGELLWVRPFEAAASGAASALSSGADGEVQVAGYTSAAWGGPRLGLYDSVAAELSADGDMLSLQQFGREELDQATGVSAAGDGQLYLTQNVRGSDRDGSDAAFLLRRTLQVR